MTEAPTREEDLPELALRLRRAMDTRGLRQIDVARWLLKRRGGNPDSHKELETARQAVHRWYHGDHASIGDEREARSLAEWLDEEPDYFVIPTEVRPRGVGAAVAKLEARIDDLEARLEAALEELRRDPGGRSPKRPGAR